MHILFWKVQCQHQILLVHKESKTFAMIVSLYLHVFSHKQMYITFPAGIGVTWVSFDGLSSLIRKIIFLM